MANKLLAALFTAATISSVFADAVFAQAIRRNPGLYQRKTNKGIDDGMVRRAPGIGDERMVRKPPENIDNGIFFPRRVFKSYPGVARPKADRK